jgi:predicted DNA-binding transcriptional regulator YafY
MANKTPVHLLLSTQRITFVYTNWRGETATRTVAPTIIWYGSTKWHPEPQWFMTATDVEKNQLRDFAVKDMKDVRYAG